MMRLRSKARPSAQSRSRAPPSAPAPVSARKFRRGRRNTVVARLAETPPDVLCSADFSFLGVGGLGFGFFGFAAREDRVAFAN